MKKANNFEIVEVSLRVLLIICLNFSQFLPDVACKSVAYKNVYNGRKTKLVFLYLIF